MYYHCLLAGEGFKFTQPEYTLHVANHELCGDGVSFEITGDKCIVWVLPENGTGKRKYRFCIDTSKLFNQMMATTAGFPSGGVDFEIVQEVIPCQGSVEQESPFPVEISFPPTSKKGLWDFSLRLACYVIQEPCGTAEVNVMVHSSSGCKFVLSVFLHSIYEMRCIHVCTTIHHLLHVA